MKETVCELLAGCVLIVADGRDSYTVVRCTMAPARDGDESEVANLKSDDSDAAVIEVSDYTTGSYLLVSASSDRWLVDAQRRWPMDRWLETLASRTR